MKHEATVGLLNATVSFELKKRDDFGKLPEVYGYDLIMSAYQKSDTAFVASHTFNCVTKEDVDNLIAALSALKNTIT